MGIVAVTGEPGCRAEEVARLVAQRQHAELLTVARLDSVMREQFGALEERPGRAWPAMAGSILARLATGQHLVVAVPGVELMFRNVPGVMRVRLVASEVRRVGALMIERRVERAAAKHTLHELEKEERTQRRIRFGRATLASATYDAMLNTESLEVEALADLVDALAAARGIFDGGTLSASSEMQLQFQFRLQLAKYGISPPGNPQLKRHAFGHPSEVIFANLLDFYRIQWEYEPRSFPLQWDKHGNVLEAFTPDFYLPEFDQYVELTTMKQSHVTRKNRKVKLLKSIYPDVKIQVFYQKDFQNLIFKFGLADKGAEV